MHTRQISYSEAPAVRPPSVPPDLIGSNSITLTPGLDLAKSKSAV